MASDGSGLGGEGGGAGQARRMRKPQQHMMGERAIVALKRPGTRRMAPQAAACRPRPAAGRLMHLAGAHERARAGASR